MLELSLKGGHLCQPSSCSPDLFTSNSPDLKTQSIESLLAPAGGSLQRFALVPVGWWGVQIEHGCSQEMQVLSREILQVLQSATPLRKKSPASLAQSRPSPSMKPPPFQVCHDMQFLGCSLEFGTGATAGSCQVRAKAGPPWRTRLGPPMCASTQDTGSLLTCSFRHFAATSPNIRPRSVAVHTAKAPTVQQTGAAAISAAGGSGCVPRCVTLLSQHL